MTAAADWLLERLADTGVEVVFGNPGSTELPLVDALARQSRIRYVLGLHEAAVMGMADGYAQQGRRLAVVNVHVQPGLANAMSGILNAARSRVPMLVTVGQQVTALKDKGPFLGGDVVALARPLAKDVFEPTTADDLSVDLAWAVEIATRHPAGPVVMSLPMDVLTGRPPQLPDGGEFHRWRDPDESRVPDAARLLGSAAAPVLIAGDAVVHEHASDLVVRLAARLAAPIYGEPFAARVPVDADHPLWSGPLPGFANEIRPLLEPYDVVFAIGMPVFREFGHSPGSALPPHALLIHLDCDEEEIGRVHEPAVGIELSIASGLERILEALGEDDDPAIAGRLAGLVDRVAGRRRDAGSRLVELARERGDSPAALCLAIAEAVGPDDLVVDEALTSGRGLRTALGGRNTTANWLAHRGSALGWGLPAAVGAKLADPGRRVICIHGDGSFLFGLHALWTAARERLGVAVVVADNSGYEILRAGLEGLTGRPDGAWPGLELTDPPLDLVAISRGFGASAERVGERGRLADAFADLWQRAESGPAVLVVPITGRTPAIGYPMG